MRFKVGKYKHLYSSDGNVFFAGTGKAFHLCCEAIVRGDTTLKEFALVFTGDGFGDGGPYISETLEKENIKASFFLTGNFYRNKKFGPVIKDLIKNRNYLGSHSDRHLLYCDWIKRDSLLICRKEFTDDLNDSYLEMRKYGINRKEARYFLPPMNGTTTL
jgi:peptidoglycan/xylan/chitin deacetylase (PgdA/CDA1 family)